MPAKLPTRERLGGLPSARSGRTMARISPQAPGSAVRSQMSAVSAMQGGVQNLSRGIASLGDAAQAFADRDRQQQDFDTEVAFQQFNWDQNKAADERMRSVEPGKVTGFADSWQQDYVKTAGEFFKTVPEHLKATYEQKLFRSERELYGAATQFEQQEHKRFNVASIKDTNENVFRPRARMSTTEELDKIAGEYDQLVDSNPNLTPIEKDELKRSGRRNIALSHVDALPPEKVKTALAAKSGDNSTAGLLRRFEGYKSTAYWDVNAYRVGYGSDTVTKADGSVVKVTKDTVITQEDAERDLARRSVEFAKTAEGQVGADTWAALPENVKSPLTSVAYNYGKLPDSVVAAIKTGDTETIASAVAELPANKDRRLQEAAVISGRTTGTTLAALTDEDRDKAMSHADRRENAARVEATRLATAQQQQVKLVSDQAEDEFFRGVVAKDPSVTAIAIANDKRLTVPAKERMVKLLEHEGRSDRTEATYGKDFYSLFQRVHAPEGDPNRISDPSVLYEHVKPGGGLTLSGMEKLRTEMSGKKTPEGEAEAALKRTFFANAKGQITGSNDALGMRDPKGDELFLKFQAQAFADYEKARKEGKSAATLLNPDSPDYIGKSIASFKRPMNQWFADTIADAPQEQTAFDPASLSTLDDLVNAHRSGQVTAQVARAIAVEKGWAKPRAEPVSNAPQVPMSR